MTSGSDRVGTSKPKNKAGAQSGAVGPEELTRILDVIGVPVLQSEPVNEPASSRRRSKRDIKVERKILPGYVLAKLPKDPDATGEERYVLLKSDNYIDNEAVNKRGTINSIERSVVEELERVGLPPKLAFGLAAIYQDFEDKISSPPVSDKLKPHIGKLMVQAAAFAFNDAHSPQARKFVDRDKVIHPTAESFLIATYGDRLGIDGDLTPAMVGKLDAQLLTALSSEFKGRRNQLHEMLPTLQRRNDMKLERLYGYIPQGEDRKRKLTSLARGIVPKP